MLRILKSLLAAFALLSLPALAHAEEPTKSYPDCGREPTDAEVAAAKGAFQAGNASFNEADYARAIDYWEDAYRRDCTANPLLLNLARAYELAGRKRQAVVALETFLAREPSSGEKDQIGRRVEVLKKKIAEEDAAAASAPPPTTTAAPAPGASPATAPSDAPQSEPKAKRSPWPWVVIGVGGAAVIVGSIGYASNKSKISDLDKRCDDPKTTDIVEGRDMCVDNSIAGEGNTARHNMTASGVIAGVGVAALAGGVIWLILDIKATKSENASASRSLLRRASLLPIVSPSQSGLALSGSF